MAAEADTNSTSSNNSTTTNNSTNSTTTTTKSRASNKQFYFPNSGGKPETKSCDVPPRNPHPRFQPQADHCIGPKIKQPRAGPKGDNDDDSNTSNNNNNNNDILQNATLLQQLAERYAPVLLYHPLEQYTMASIERTFADPTAGTIYRHDESPESDLFEESLDPNTLLATTRDFNLVAQSHLFYLQHGAVADLQELVKNQSDAAQEEEVGSEDESFERIRQAFEEYTGGDGFYNDTNNGMGTAPSDQQFQYSRAPIYWRALASGNDTLSINYYMYYTWNGPNQFGVLTSYNGTAEYARLAELPPWGQHEGDWEVMTVTICQQQQQDVVQEPLAITYRQHGFGQVKDCTQGECTLVDPDRWYRPLIQPFQDETNDTATTTVSKRPTLTHPIGFVALNTHEVYGESVEELIYDEAWPVEFWVNFQGFLFVHRTAYLDEHGNARMFLPNETNVLRIPEQIDIPENVTDESEYVWAYGGAWGATTGSSNVNLQYPTCLDNSTVRGPVPCPSEEENPIFSMVLQMLRVEEPRSALIQGARLLYDYLVDTSLGQSPVGPAAQPSYDALETMRVGNAPIWRLLGKNDTGDIYCERLLEIPDTTRLPYDTDNLPLVGTVAGIVILYAAVTVGCIVYFVFWREVEKDRPLLPKDEAGIYARPNWRVKSDLYHYASLHTFVYLTTLAGWLVFFVNYERLLDLRVLGLFFPQVSDDGALAFGTLTMVVDSAVFISLWIRARDVWGLINVSYYDMIGDDDKLHEIRGTCGRIWNEADSKRTKQAYTVIYSTLLMSLLTSVLLAAIATMNVALSFAMGEVCSALVGSLDNICFDLNLFGSGEKIKCGQDFKDFCENWARTERTRTMWATFVVVLSHFFHIATASMALVHFETVERGIKRLPSREEYAALLESLSAEKDENIVDVDEYQDAQLDEGQGVLDVDNGPQQNDGDATKEKAMMDSTNDTPNDDEAETNHAPADSPRAWWGIFG